MSTLRGYRVHCFAHNGDLPGIEELYHLDPAGPFQPVGNTDSELTFCLLMERLGGLWASSQGIPSLHSRRVVVADFASEVGKLGPANFLYSDSEALFVHGHVRTQVDGSLQAPGLHYISVTCNHGIGHSELASIKLESERLQRVTLVSTVPLTEGDWQPMHAGELLVLKAGEIIDRVPGPGYRDSQPIYAPMAGVQDGP
jgi:glutamine amidotransferase